MSRLSKEVRRSAEQQIAAEGGWLMGVAGIVAENEDPERQHRVKVIIPSIDEDVVFDEWARQMVFCLGNGFGAAFVPPKGSEVVLFGQLGQKFHLFYASVYNEEMLVPEGYENEYSVGAHVPGNLAFRAEEIAIFSAREVNVHADELAKTDAENIESLAGQKIKTTGATVESTASGENKVAGETVKLDGTTIQVNGTTIQISGSGNVAVTAGGNLTLQGRVVNKVGPAI